MSRRLQASSMAKLLVSTWVGLQLAGQACGQQQCYYGPGAQYRAFGDVVPCNGTGASACCLLGDTCLSGNTCYNHATGDLYQYGCTDINYEDASCPYKCGLDPNKSPWIALEYCNDVPDLSDTWICHSPDSCGCDWQPSQELLVLQPRGCQDMGSDAYVAIYAPSKLAPYVSLPSTIGGSTGYYSPTISDGTSTWVETAIAGYTPLDFTQLTTYRPAPTTPVQVEPGVTPGPATYAAAATYTAPPSTPVSSTAASTTISTSSSSSSPSPATATNTPATSLSTGAKIGIGVGAGGGALLIAALAIAVCCLRGRKKRPLPQSPHAPLYPGTPPMQQQHIPPYLPAQTNWPLHWQHGDQGQDRYYNYLRGGSPRSDLSRSKSGRKMSHSRSPSGAFLPMPSPPMPSPPLELSGDAIRRVHEMAGEVVGFNHSPSGTPAPAYTRDNRF